MTHRDLGTELVEAIKARDRAQKTAMEAHKVLERAQNRVDEIKDTFRRTVGPVAKVKAFSGKGHDGLYAVVVNYADSGGTEVRLLPLFTYRPVNGGVAKEEPAQLSSDPKQEKEGDDK